MKAGLLQMNMKIIDDLQANSLEDAAFGAILGAFIGDSCGSYYEFQAEPANTETMIQCMNMPGGGPHGVGAGQITDDSEMAMALLWGLINSNSGMQQGKDNVMDCNEIAAMYKEWFDSEPFDMGGTTMSALQYLANQKKMPILA